MPHEQPKVIDWDEIRQRLNETFVDRAASMSPDSARRVLRERAAALGQTNDDEQSADRIEVLRFRVGDERYAVETTTVREVLPPRKLTAVPSSPAALLGVTNLRGEILAVMDPEFIVGVTLADTSKPWVVVLGDDRAELGIAADAVDEVARLDLDEVRPSESLAPGVDHDLIRGITAEPVIVLNGHRLLNHESLHIDDA